MEYKQNRVDEANEANNANEANETNKATDATEANEPNQAKQTNENVLLQEKEFKAFFNPLKESPMSLGDFTTLGICIFPKILIVKSPKHM